MLAAVMMIASTTCSNSKDENPKQDENPEQKEEELNEAPNARIFNAADYDNYYWYSGEKIPLQKNVANVVII